MNELGQSLLALSNQNKPATVSGEVSAPLFCRFLGALVTTRDQTATDFSSGRTASRRNLLAEALTNTWIRAPNKVIIPERSMDFRYKLSGE